MGSNGAPAGAMTKSFDWALGAAALSFVGQDLARGRGHDLVSATVLALNATVGVLFLVRHPSKKSASLHEHLACAASVPLSALALALAPAAATWPVAARILFACAGGAAILALIALGRSFAVLPSVRRVVRRGPFQIVRHPIYGCELCMVMVCAGVSDHAYRLLAPILAVVLVVVRIRIEERLLEGEADYRGYRQRVRWRLLPGVW